MLNRLSLFLALSFSFMQAGAQLFAITVIVTSLTSNPPDSLSMLEGEYGYDSSPFWETFPNITTLFLIIALIVNWKTSNRKYLLVGFGLFITGALYSIFILGPASESHASNWLMLDWILFFITILTCISLTIPFFKTTNSNP